MQTIDQNKYVFIHISQKNSRKQALCISWKNIPWATFL